MAIKDDEKIKEFMSIASKAYKSLQNKMDHDKLLRQHYSMTEISSDLENEVSQKN